MKIFGIDQSLTGTAVCVLNGSINPSFHLFSTEKNKEVSQSVDYTFRIMSIRDSIKELIKQEKPNYIAMEGLSFGSVGRLAELGALSYFIRELFIGKIPFIVIPPTVVKKYWTGKGNCGKDEMINEAIVRKIEIPFKKKYKKVIYPDDNCVDSIAIASFLKDFLDKKLTEETVSKIEIYSFS